MKSTFILKTTEKIRNSLYAKNVLTLASSSTLAQLISVLTAPILYRIYAKEDYGTLGLYMAMTGVIGVFSTMQYSQTILIEKGEDHAKSLMWLNRIINIFVAATVFLAILLFGDHIGHLFGNKKIEPWLYFVPMTIFFAGQSEIFSIWANRKKKYKILAINGLISAALVPVVSISIGLYKPGPLGLFMGLFTSQIVPAIMLSALLMRQDNLGLKYLNFELIKIKLVEYSKFPIYNLPSEFINRLTNQLPVFMLSGFVGPAAVGLYNLAVRMLGLPIQLIGGAIGTVFKQRATEDFNRDRNFKTIYLKTLKSLGWASVPMIIIILLFGPKLFEFVFGNEWRISGVIAQILIVFFVMKLIVSPLSYGWVIVNKLNVSFYVHIYMLISNFLVFYFGFIWFDDYLMVLAMFSINYSLIYLYTAFINYRFSFKFSNI
ncbi:MAG: oligosaccharide flippase family protein [Algoriphagus sp.]|nr:oligosaccharide flippase family protein [Algoriphagus sp.]